MLTDKQNRFAEEYAKDLNMIRAYKSVYKNCKSDKSASHAASRLLTNVDISARVRELQKIAAERAQVTVDSVVRDLVEVKERCMQAKPVMVWDNDQHCYVASDAEYEFDSRGANTALKLLGDHLGMFQKNVKVTGSLDAGQSKVDALIDQLKQQADDES
jgi:phage terminase small subunit